MIFRRKKKGFIVHPTLARLSKKRPILKRHPGKTLSKRIERPVRRARNYTGTGTKLKRLVLLTSGGALLLFVINTLFISSQLNLTTIKVIEDDTEITNHLLTPLFTDLRGSNLLLLNTKNLEELFQQKYPTYESLTIQKSLPHTLIINLTSFSPIATITIESTDSQGIKLTTTSVLNAEGMLIEPEENKDYSALPALVMTSEKKLIGGTKVISKENLAFALEAMQNYEDKFDMKIINSFYLKTERELHLWTDRNFYVWLDLTQNLDTQLNKLKMALPKLNIYNADLEYIDLRISGINGEKVIYKIK